MGEEIAALQARGKVLLERALPRWRAEHLNDAWAESRYEPLLRSLSDWEKNGEAQIRPLSAREEELCRELARRQAAMEDPDLEIPDAQGFDPDAYACSFWFCAKNATTSFVFSDEGPVLLFECNEGQWMCRRDPVFSACLAEDALMESASSCLVRDVEGGVWRLSYARMESAGELSRAALYGHRGKSDGREENG